jgi:biotin synthase-like enzyme
MKEALEKVKSVGFNEDCMFCALKDTVVNDALKGK